jgi:hypothetical protein
VYTRALCYQPLSQAAVPFPGDAPMPPAWHRSASDAGDSRARPVRAGSMTNRVSAMSSAGVYRCRTRLEPACPLTRKLNRKGNVEETIMSTASESNTPIHHERPGVLHCGVTREGFTAVAGDTADIADGEETEFKRSNVTVRHKGSEYVFTRNGGTSCRQPAATRHAGR